MTRIALIGDSHFCEHSRFEECSQIHRWIAEDIAERRVDLVCHSGDLFDRKSTPLERRAVAYWLERVADVAPVVIVKGNHDAPSDVKLFERLSTRHPVTVAEDAAVCLAGGVAIAALPWPRKADLLLAGSEAEGSEYAAKEALRDMIRRLGETLAKQPSTMPRVLLAHAMVDGSRTSAGQPLVGAELSLGLDDLALCPADAYLLGHVHCGQTWDINGAPVIYPGSPRRTAFGEAEEKRYIIVEIEGGKVTWYAVPTPATQMVLVDVQTIRTHAGEVAFSDHGMEPDVDGAEVRFRWSVDGDLREVARIAARGREERMLAAGAISVQLEETVTPTVTARNPEIATAPLLREKIQLYWAAQGFDPGPRRDPLLSKLAQIEEKHHAAR